MLTIKAGVLQNAIQTVGGAINKNAEKDLKEFFDFCLSIKAKYEQECIAIVINNSMQFI
jgi:hypothetical protein